MKTAWGLVAADCKGQSWWAGAFREVGSRGLCWSAMFLSVGSKTLQQVVQFLEAGSMCPEMLALAVCSETIGDWGRPKGLGN